MHIIPSMKGFVSGMIIFTFKDEICDRNPILVDNIKEISSDKIINSPICWKWTYLAQTNSINSRITNTTLHIQVPKNVQYLILIEKEGVYNRLCDDKFYMFEN